MKASEASKINQIGSDLIELGRKITELGVELYNIELRKRLAQQQRAQKRKVAK